VAGAQKEVEAATAVVTTAKESPTIAVGDDIHSAQCKLAFE